MISSLTLYRQDILKDQKEELQESLNQIYQRIKSNYAEVYYEIIGSQKYRSEEGFRTGRNDISTKIYMILFKVF